MLKKSIEIHDLDMGNENTMVLLPRLGLYYLWQELNQEERIAFFGEENKDLKIDAHVLDELLQDDLKDISDSTRSFIQMAWQMHSKISERLSLYLQIACHSEK